MKIKNKLLLVSLLSVFSITLIGGTINGLPLHVKKLGDNAIDHVIGIQLPGYHRYPAF